METTVPDDDRILSEAELDAITGMSSTTRWRERKRGRFPVLLDLSPGRKANSMGQIRQWLRERRDEAERRAIANAEPRKPGRPRIAEAVATT